ncbi:hypothetical protein [Phyllobacterium sp. SB3]|uniref:hypothetical protein n=1 Tax=Phyllobacterium sp. SB3 TaxID=3156073 RepID=UPI0032AEB034
MSIAFELISEDYYAIDGTHLAAGDEDGKADWESKHAWNNYQRCWIGGSQTSSSPGIAVSNGTKPFSFDCNEYHFSADPLPVRWDTFFDTQAFGIYLLGHDAVADHKIKLHSRTSDGSYTLEWTGKIAEYYVGKTEFEHGFIAKTEGVRFDSINLFGFDIAKARESRGTNLAAAARNYIAPFVAEPDRFHFEERNNFLHAVLMA